MTPPVYMLTGNKVKFDIARHIFSTYGISLLQYDCESEEIQSLDVSEVARRAVLSVEKKDGPIFKTDVGFYIHALNGFPGPLIKFATKTLSAQNWLDLMSSQEDRRVSVRECLACVWPDGHVETFVDEISGYIERETQGSGHSINQVLRIEGFDKPIACYSANEQLDRWIKNQTIYTQLAQRLAGERK